MSIRHLPQSQRLLWNRLLIIIGWVTPLLLFASFLLLDGFHVAALDSAQLYEPPAVTKSSQDIICPPTISYGETIQCSIDAPGEVDSYGFSASAGDVILARMSSGQCCNNRKIELYEPGGSLLISELGYTRVEITHSLSYSGDYTLTTSFEGGSGGSLTGDYELHLQRLNGPAGAVPMVYGQTITGTIDSAAEYAAHTFSAEVGDVILARMSSEQCCNGREIRLYGPSGNLVISETDYTRVEITQTISIPGNYMLLTGFSGGSSGSDTGDYELYLQRLNGPADAVPMTYGQTITGTIDLAAEYEAHTFPAEMGDVILARMSSGQCCNGREIRLYGPSGNLVLSETGYTRVEMTRTLSISGNYTLLTDFSGGSGGSDTGDYALHLQRLNGPGNAAPIFHGQTLTGVIEFAAEFDAFIYSANAGDLIVAKMSSNQCCNRREIRLYGSDGGLLISELDYTSVELTHPVSTTGDYALLVSFNAGSGGSLTGDYSLSLTCLDLPCGAQLPHRIYLPSIRD